MVTFISPYMGEEINSNAEKVDLTDVGNFNCPYCHGLGTPLYNLLDRIRDKKKKHNENSNDE